MTHQVLFFVVGFAAGAFMISVPFWPSQYWHFNVVQVQVIYKQSPVSNCPLFKTTPPPKPNMYTRPKKTQKTATVYCIKKLYQVLNLLQKSCINLVIVSFMAVSNVIGHVILKVTDVGTTLFAAPKTP